MNDDAGKFLVEYATHKRADVVIMDPPRSGSSQKFLESVLKIKPERSCVCIMQSDTPERDVDMLMKGGYKVLECRPFDMFPFCDHVETVVLLSKLDVDKHIDVEIKLD